MASKLLSRRPEFVLSWSSCCVDWLSRSSDCVLRRRVLVPDGLVFVELLFDGSVLICASPKVGLVFVPARSCGIYVVLSFVVRPSAVARDRRSGSGGARVSVSERESSLNLS